MPATHSKLTFRNETEEDIVFIHIFKNVQGNTFTVRSRGGLHVENVTVCQTHERFCLLGSDGKKITGKEFDTDDLPDFTGVVVTKVGDEYILTKVRRTTWWTWLQSQIHRIPKLFSQDETLPTRQTSSRRRTM
ncbi:hypothetical protein M758_4G017900 [Ceratodon purpureus]|nr:hypothetical protein M758_4G017900 [Ceratodon purpureus]